MKSLRYELKKCGCEKMNIIHTQSKRFSQMPFSNAWIFFHCMLMMTKWLSIEFRVSCSVFIELNKMWNRTGFECQLFIEHHHPKCILCSHRWHTHSNEQAHFQWSVYNGKYHERIKPDSIDECLLQFSGNSIEFSTVYDSAVNATWNSNGILSEQWIKQREQLL